MIVEEASFVAADVFYKVVIPLLEVSGTSLLMISTPESDTNYYSQLCNMVDARGKPLFHIIKVGMVCDWCQSNVADPSTCKHRETERPSWKSFESAQLVRAMYGTRKNLLMRESMGMVVSDTECAFKSSWVFDMFKRMRVPLPENPPYIFIACDPNGGGSSDMAIMSVCRVDGMFIVRSQSTGNTATHTLPRTRAHW